MSRRRVQRHGDTPRITCEAVNSTYRGPLSFSGPRQECSRLAVGLFRVTGWGSGAASIISLCAQHRDQMINRDGVRNLSGPCDLSALEAFLVECDRRIETYNSERSAALAYWARIAERRLRAQLPMGDDFRNLVLR